jgi:hypothetical protein
MSETPESTQNTAPGKPEISRHDIPIAVPIMIVGIIMDIVALWSPRDWLVIVGSTLLAASLTWLLGKGIRIRMRTLVTFAAVLITLLGLALVFQMIKLNKRLMVTSPFPRSDGMIADFKTGLRGPARNVFQENFNIISDSEWNGTSKCWYSLEYEPVADDAGVSSANQFLRLDYEINPRSEKGAEAYVGVYTDFSFPPPQSYDVSAFTQFGFRIRKDTPDNLTNASVYVFLATDNQPKTPGYYDWCEHVVPPGMINTRWSTVQFPLSASAFTTPAWSSQQRELDLKRVFRIGIAIRSIATNTIHGHIDIDDIRFVK